MVDNHTEWAGDYREGYFIDNEILGYSPSKGRKVNSQKYVRGELVYDVMYTIDDKGLRITPQYKFQSDDLGIVFFGGSNTFGEGLQDDETLPFLVGEISKRNVYNFAFHGYGPHQMLSAIQHGLVDEIVHHDRIVIIYPTDHSHVARIAGFSSWDKHGPQYNLSKEGTIYYDGHFDDNMADLKKSTEFLQTSFTYKKFFIERNRVRHEHVKLYLESIDASRKIMEEKYLQADFHVILGGSKLHSDLYGSILSGLKERNINVHLVSDILPNYESNPSRYGISHYDGHNNMLANKYIADYVVNEILK